MDFSFLGLLQFFAGFLLGILGDWLFKEYALEKLRRLSRRRRLKPFDRSDWRKGETVLIGMENSHTCVIDGDGVMVIDPKNIVCTLERDPLLVPANLRDEVKRVAEMQQRKKAAQLPYAWNGKMLHITRFNVSRTPDNEASRIELSVRTADYFHFMATNVRFYDEAKRLGYSSPVRKALVSDFKDWRKVVPPNVVNGLPVNLFVVTELDNKLFFSKRSMGVAIAAGELSAAVNENLHPEHDYLGQGQRLDINRLIMRGLEQEVGWHDSMHSGKPDDPKAKVNLLGFGIHTLTANYGLFGYVELPITSSGLREAFSTLARDRIETDCLLGMNFDAPTLCGFIHHNRLYDFIGAACVYCMIHKGITFSEIRQDFAKLQMTSADAKR